MAIGTVQTKLAKGAARRGANGEYYEDIKEAAARYAFEVANPYKVGSQVIILKNILGNYRCPYLHKIAKVCNIKTIPESGPCFQITYGGITLNIFDLNEVCFDDQISRYLYT